jgi:hypothetical protein
MGLPAAGGGDPVIMTGLRWGRGALGALLVAALAGCASADEPAVRNVASSFAAGDAQARCDLLATGTLTALLADGACPEAIGQLPLGRGDVVSVEVWGEDALVRLTDDTLFLTREDAGWRVSAAACQATGPDRPYECRLEAS